MGNKPDKLSDTIRVRVGEDAGKEAYVQSWDWVGDNIKARLKKDDPKTTINLKFSQVVFIE